MRAAMLILLLISGCSILVGGNPLSMPSPNPRKKTCIIRDNTVGVDAVATIVAGAIVLTGLGLQDSGYEVGHKVVVGGTVVGAPFALSFVGVSIGRELCNL